MQQTEKEALSCLLSLCIVHNNESKIKYSSMAHTLFVIYVFCLTLNTIHSQYLIILNL